MKPDLTIAIPTFNRAAKLRAQLDRLMPQLTAEVRCCVYDNASTDETWNIVEAYAAGQVTGSRSLHNHGLARNLLRCFEECQTEWLWVLSDDDPISPRAVSDALELMRNPAADFIHTSTPLCRHNSEVLVSDVGQLLQQVTLSSLFFISAGLYRMPSFRPVLVSFISSLSTWVPQTVMLLALLEAKGGKTLLSPTSLIAAAPGTPRFSTLDFILRLGQMPEYLGQAGHQKMVAEHIWREHLYWSLLMGLREADEPAQIRQWQRVRKQAGRQLRAYQAPSPWAYVARNWFRSGHRKESLVIVHNALILALLGCCPAFLFRYLLKVLPLPHWVKVVIHERGKETMPAY